ncbi:hypothetical protein SAMN05216188_101135 [Lentzea xinjiangensis]|uniref:Uncharacterized protein n=1 Tax=Lentzea xinjiangensis TaxID=402600 RepID=A0A1H8ZS07_9PSEU|nr:hypothetical protein [Lentzea xinjiangensis]SEP67202.1 hypothetical protein SAMN05216188_101135 [Lentzea xinjiangensis]
MSTRPSELRTLRGAALALTSAALTIAAHGLGGGELPEFIHALPLVVLIAFAAASLADRRTGKLSVMAGLGTAQLAQHLLLTWVNHEHTNTLTGQMVLAHLVAAALTGLLLFHAENALFRLFAAVTRLIPRRLTPLPVTTPVRTFDSTPYTRHEHAVLHTRAHGRRGPPSSS